MEIDLQHSVGAVVGATGAIGRICALLLAESMPDLLLIGRRNNALDEVKYEIERLGKTRVRTSTEIDHLQQADVIITVSSAVGSIIQPEHLKAGAIVCDVARPRDVSRKVVERRNDVLVIEGGMVKIPGAVNFNFDFGFPPQMAFACMAETILLSLAQRYESYTLGKTLSLAKVQEISQLAKAHGFQLGGFRSFEKPVYQHDIENIKLNLHKPKKGSRSLS